MITDQDAAVMLFGMAPVTALGVATAITGPGRPFDQDQVVLIEDPDEAIKVAGGGSLRIAVVDPFGPGLSQGLALCRRFKEQTPVPPYLLAFCGCCTARDIALCHLSGIDSLVSVLESPERLSSAVCSTLGGNREWLLGPATHRVGGATAVDSEELTPREREILWMVSDRCTNEQIARTLFISPNTVKNHVAAVLRKLGVARRSALYSTLASGESPGCGPATGTGADAD